MGEKILLLGEWVKVVDGEGTGVMEEGGDEA